MVEPTALPPFFRPDCLQTNNQPVIGCHHATLFSLPNIPAEIWAEVFIESFFDEGLRVVPSASPLRVSQVCKAWRDIALATVCLWNFLHVDVGEHLNPELIKTWLNRSGSHTLSFDLQFNSPSLTTTTIGIFLELFAAHLHRWKRISLSFRNLNSISVPNIPAGGAPVLETADVRFIKGPSNHYTTLQVWLCSLLHAAPRLRRVVWHGSTPFSLPWAQLTYINCDSCSTGQALDILGRMPEVTECDFACDSSGRYDVLDPNVPRRLKFPILLPRLRRLSVRNVISRVSPLSFYDGLVLPVLGDMYVSTVLWELPSFLSLLSRSSCFLYRLSLVGFKIADYDLLACLQHVGMGSLVHLYIRCQGVVTDRILQFLTIRDTHHPLPNLKFIRFIDSIQSTDRTLVDMIESRFNSTRIASPTYVSISGLSRINHPIDLKRLASLSYDYVLIAKIKFSSQ